MDQLLQKMHLLIQLEYFKINLGMFVNFDEPQEIKIQDQPKEPEFNQNLLRKVDELRTFC